MVEVEEQILRQLQGYETIFNKVGRGKDRQKFLQIVKDNFPDVQIPEIDAANPYEERIAALEKQIADRDKAALERSAHRTIADERRKLREDGFDDDGIGAVEKYMMETGNPDYKSAAAYVRSQVKDAGPLPTTFAGQRFDWFSPPKEGADHQLLMKNPKQFSDQMASRWLAEQRGRRAGPWGNQ